MHTTHTYIESETQEDYIDTFIKIHFGNIPNVPILIEILRIYFVFYIVFSFTDSTVNFAIEEIYGVKESKNHRLCDDSRLKIQCSRTHE